MLRNLPPVTKNLLILNVLFWIGSLVLSSNGFDAIGELGAYYINSPNFKPYQLVTHFFMHSLGVPGQIDIFHILFNMLMLAIFGSHLERLWGAKRFFIVYVSSALGAFLLYNVIGGFQIYELKQTIESLGYSITDLNNSLLGNANFRFKEEDRYVLESYARLIDTPMVGASGAVFGLLAAFGMLFPNTPLQFLFIPVPIKAKYLIGGYLAFEVYNSIFKQGGDIAHLAHVGGAIVGIVFILVWRKTDRNNFY